MSSKANFKRILFHSFWSAQAIREFLLFQKNSLPNLTGNEIECEIFVLLFEINANKA